MSTTTFTAGVQYDDWRGDIALDDEDFNNLRKYLTQQNKIADGHVITGFKTYMHGDILKKDRKIGVDIYLQKGTGEYTEEKIELDIEQFFGFFKRINITASRKGALQGKEIEIEN